MTLALEPKMVFINEFTVGIESVFMVTENGQPDHTGPVKGLFLLKGEGP